MTTRFKPPGRRHSINQHTSGLASLPRASYRGLTNEQLVTIAQAGDREARERLLGQNLPLVVKIAVRWSAAGHELEDLIQEGLFGLNNAITFYDPIHGASFATYGYMAALRAIQRMTQVSTGLIRTRRDPLGSEAITRLKERVQRVESLEQRHFRVPDRSSVPPDEQVVQNEATEHAVAEVRHLIEFLAGSRRRVIEWRLDGLSQLEISHLLGVSKSRVGQLETDAMREMRGFAVQREKQRAEAAEKRKAAARRAAVQRVTA